LPRIVCTVSRLNSFKVPHSDLSLRQKHIRAQDELAVKAERRRQEDMRKQQQETKRQMDAQMAEVNKRRYEDAVRKKVRRHQECGFLGTSRGASCLSFVRCQIREVGGPLLNSSLVALELFCVHTSLASCSLLC
jgi:hypothetical protein